MNHELFANIHRYTENVFSIHTDYDLRAYSPNFSSPIAFAYIILYIWFADNFQCAVCTDHLYTGPFVDISWSLCEVVLQYRQNFLNFKSWAFPMCLEYRIATAHNRLTSTLSDRQTGTIMFHLK